jgi:phenylacetate-CoA ligase
VSMGLRRPGQAVNLDEIARLFPPPPEYYERDYFAPPDEIESRQLVRLQQRAMTAYQVPFFRRRWDEAGFDPRSLATLEDLWRVPMYAVDDIRKSIEANPPWGDYQGVTPERALSEPMRVYMSGGTSGTSRPTFYTQWDREVGGILNARGMYRQGVRPGDILLNSWSYGTHNGAWSFDEAMYRWLNCVIITTSTGNVTPTEKQVDLAIQYGANGILTTGDYFLRIVEVARERGYEIGKDLKITSLTNLGDRDTLEKLVGLPYYRSYGFHEVQWVATECPARDGLHIFEDAFVVQVVDPETGERLPDGQTGSMVITEIYKTGSPQFRYNNMDLSYLYPREKCSCGSWLRKIGPFAGRGDNMVKLRGINVWPEAAAEVVSSIPGVTSDWFVRAIRENNRDEMVISVVSDLDPSRFEDLRLAMEQRLASVLGLQVRAEVVRAGELDAWTEVATSPKPKRFRDERSPS